MKASQKTEIILLLGIYIASLVPSYSQELPDGERDKLSVAFSAAHHGYDPAFGIEVTTRSIFNNHLAARFRGSIQLLEAYKAADERWIAYHSFGVALVYRANIVERARFYAELGGFALLPDYRFTSRRFVQGIYELNGLEIFILKQKNLAFFLAGGPAFIHAFAEKLEGQPRYGNGLIYMNGVRFYF